INCEAAQVAFSAARQASEDRCQDPLRSRNLETGKAGLGGEWAGGVIPARPEGIFSSMETIPARALLRNLRWTQAPAEELVGYFLGETFSSEDNTGYIAPAGVWNFVAQL